MKTILIIDPAPSKRDYLIDDLRQAGFTTIGVTPIEACSGLKKCDFSIIRDFTDVNGIKNDLKTLPFPDGVICYHQAAITFANTIAHELELTPIWKDRKLDLANKIAVNEVWKKAGLNVPLDFNFKDLESKKNSYPIVVKPANLQGSIGVKQCHDLAEVKSWANLLNSLQLPFEVDGKKWDMIDLYQSDTTPFIQEKICAFAPWEYENSVEMVVCNGEIEILGFIDKQCVKNEDYFLESLFIYPAITPVAKFSEELKAYVRALGIINSIVHFEFKATERGVLPIELNCRVVGEPMASLLFEHEKINLANLLANISIGEALKIKTSYSLQKWSGFSFVHPPTSIMDTYKVFNGLDFSVPDAIKLDFVSAYEKGEKIVYDESMHSYPLGYFTFRTYDKEALIKFKCFFLDSINFKC